MQAPNLCCLSVVALIGLSAPANAAGVQVLTGPGLHYEIGRLGVPSATVGAPDTKGALYTFFVRAACVRRLTRIPTIASSPS